MNKRGNETREIRTNTTEKQKNHKKTLWTAISQQVGQSRRNKQISRNTLSAKTESRRNRQ